MRRTIVLIGATGTFGSRLASMAARISGIDLVVTSRQLDKAQAFAHELGQQTGTPVRGLAYTHGADTAALLATSEPWLVIDAAGPFQHAGYDTARAAIDAGAHWIDLADAADYIQGFAPALDERARRRGTVAATGASSTPALSFAAVQALSEGWRSVDSIEIGIYPAGRSMVGEAVLRAVLSYTGLPVAIWRDGRSASVTGWGTAEKIMLTSVPHRYRSPVATYDHALLSRTFGARNVSFYAGLESPAEHLGLLVLAKMRARGVLPRLEWLAPLLHRARRWTAPYCGDTGAMQVCVRGIDSVGEPTLAQWNLLAARGHGPYVPVLPALALIRKLLQNALPGGAFCAADLLDLREIEDCIGDLAISAATDAGTKQRAMTSPIAA